MRLSISSSLPIKTGHFSGCTLLEQICCYNWYQILRCKENKLNEQQSGFFSHVFKALK